MRLNKSLLGSVVISGLGVVVAVSALISSPAEARYHHYRHWRPAYRAAYHPHFHHRWHPIYRRAQTYQPSISAMVVDANSGKTLYASNEDQPRHPASITKVMTLYLLFEQIEKGRLRLDSQIPISAHAAAQAPTKLGLPAGATIRVEDAIKAIVTESANDMAVAVAEAVGGDEGRFAALMTEKARSLGMSHTLYRNASGLPNDEQITTARDLILLGRAIQERFPSQYAYFSTRVFYYQGRAHVNHNHLLGRIDGMDGIKTGYTRGSGFNLLASVRRDGRHVISVVLGGTTAGGRDRIMANLLDRNIELASVGDRAGPMVAERRPAAPVQVADAEDGPIALPPVVPPPAARPVVRASVEAPVAVASAPAPVVRVATATPAARPRLAVVSGAPRMTLPDQTGSIQIAADRRRIVLDGSTSVQADGRTSYTATPATLRWVAGPAPAATRMAAVRPADMRAARNEPATLPAERAPASVVLASAGKLDVVQAEPVKQSPQTSTEQPPVPHVGWMIQIGATDDAGKANELLSRARSQDHAGLASARPFTEKVQKGDLTLYRARFAGLEPNQAEAACRTLKRSGFDCFATKN